MHWRHCLTGVGAVCDGRHLFEAIVLTAKGQIIVDSHMRARLLAKKAKIRAFQLPAT